MSARHARLRGEWYDSRDPELLAAAGRVRLLMPQLERAALDRGRRDELFRELLGEYAPGAWIELPFFCEYGTQIRIGAETFVNVNCVFQDCAPITIGSHGLIGPAVQLYTAIHPLEPERRILGPDERERVAAPYRTRAEPITIGDRVWIGGGAIVLPGVTIGDEAVIGAGSVVTDDIPARAVAVGQPARVQRIL